MDLFAAQGLAQTSAEQIAEAAGVSVRTFHRYFPQKADAVLPALDSLWDEFARLVAVAPGDAPLSEVVTEAFLRVHRGPEAQRHIAFYAIMTTDPQLENMWLRLHARSERKLRPILASRSGAAPDSPDIALLAAVILAAARLVSELRGEKPRQEVDDLARTLFSRIEEFG